MDVKYIYALVALSLFVLLLIIAAVTFYKRDKAEWIRRLKFEDMYAGNIAKMEYDFAIYDRETELLLERRNHSGQITLEDVLPEARESQDIFGKIDSDGVEEITGNYKPE